MNQQNKPSEIVPIAKENIFPPDVVLLSVTPSIPGPNMVARNKESGREFIFENNEKDQLVTKLIIAYEEIAFLMEEKEKGALQLIRVTNALKISEEQAREVNKKLESFSHSMFHDLRAPLRAINFYSQKVKNTFEVRLDLNANRLINKIVNNAKKMGLLIDGIVSYTRIGERVLFIINTPMEAIVTGICNELKSRNFKRKIDIHINELLPALADKGAITEVWKNLILNAIKYSRLKDPAMIEIGSTVQETEITYYIKDNGAGFDMRYAGKLFGLFNRMHSNEEFEGTGVKLALVNRLITKLGGRVWADATVNEGAIFYFTLPRPTQ
ncbi:MAG TPA: ATP-binding protein [Ferruginibacter sp.]|nr:ATP-binding protein [Ferruginibacter sp.]